MKIDIKYDRDEQQNADELISDIKALFPLARITRSKGDKYLHIYVILDYRWKNCLR